MLSYYLSKIQEQLSEELVHVQQAISTLPVEDFFICHQGKYTKWYKYSNNIQQYISKTQKEYASMLATQKYLLLRLNEIKKELEYVRMLSCYCDNEPSQLLLSDSSYSELMDFSSLRSTNNSILDSTYISEWRQAKYNSLSIHPESKIYKSISGNYLRSKSEAMIDMLLFKEGISYRYESEIILSGTTKYPDFTILHPHTNQIIYWEHFGMMNNPKYARDASMKLLDYIENNIIPNHNLICTYETSDNPLTPDIIQKQIDIYLR